MSDFPFVEVKLDLAFPSACADDALRRLACRQMVEFAHASGARTVAEGVEDRDEPMKAQKLARYELRVRETGLV